MPHPGVLRWAGYANHDRRQAACTIRSGLSHFLQQPRQLFARAVQMRFLGVAEAADVLGHAGDLCG